MHSKIFVMSMGLAASVWLTGCQNTSATKNVACGSKTCASETATCKAGCKDAHVETTRADAKRSDRADSWRTEKTEKAARLLTRQKTPPTSVPAAPCTTCARCGGACGAPEPAAKSPEVATASCSSCAAKTGTAVAATTTPSPAIASLPPSMPQPASQSIAPPPTMPGSETVLPVGVVPAGSVQTGTIPISGPGVVQSATAPVNYGPGVEVVGGGQPITAPATTVLPGPQANGKNEMTVRFGQANDYKTVVGEIYQFRRAWKLRYTAVESEDRYGGSLTLVGDNLENLKDGQIVQVEGTVLPSEDRVSGTRYQVNRVQVLEPNMK